MLVPDQRCQRVAHAGEPLRGVVDRPPVAPQRACASIIEAVDYCCQMLTAEGIKLSAPILKLQSDLKKKAGYGGSQDSADPR